MICQVVASLGQLGRRGVCRGRPPTRSRSRYPETRRLGPGSPTRNSQYTRPPVCPTVARSATVWCCRTWSCRRQSRTTSMIRSLYASSRVEGEHRASVSFIAAQYGGSSRALPSDSAFTRTGPPLFQGAALTDCAAPGVLHPARRCVDVDVDVAETHRSANGSNATGLPSMRSIRPATISDRRAPTVTTRAGAHGPPTHIYRPQGANARR